MKISSHLGNNQIYGPKSALALNGALQSVAHCRANGAAGGAPSSAFEDGVGDGEQLGVLVVGEGVEPLADGLGGAVAETLAYQ